ncbi:MAG: hypothetical protein IH846_10400 [Acidobacteria bacterium]|nr:hypothetical protein [Acidobacteriota bacterium]
MQEPHPEPESPPPEGYVTWKDWVDRKPVDLALSHPSWWKWFWAATDSLRHYRDQLRAYAARRAGDPQENDRYQRYDRWEEWSAGPLLPRPCASTREQARNFLGQGMSYEYTLWWVATMEMIGGSQLDRRKADTIKKAVDREYRAQRREDPPGVPSGWWHSAQEWGPFEAWGPMPGLIPLVPAWTPREPPDPKVMTPLPWPGVQSSWETLGG